MATDSTFPQQTYSFSQLSLNERKELVKYFFTGVFASSIVFGVWIATPFYWWFGVVSGEIGRWLGILFPILLCGLIISFAI